MPYSCPGEIWQVSGLEICHRERYFEFLPLSTILVVLLGYTAFAFSTSRAPHSTNDPKVERPENRSNPDAFVVLRPQGVLDRLRLSAELLLALAQVFSVVYMCIAESVRSEYSSWAPIVPFTYLVESVYMFVLVLYRYVHRLDVGPPLVGRPFCQCAFLYTLNLGVVSVVWYQHVVFPYSTNSFRLSVFMLGISAILWLILFTSPIGDGAARVYTTKDAQPGSESDSSLLRYIVCCWSTGLIFLANRKQLEPSDVWELSEEAHAYHYFTKLAEAPKQYTFFWKVLSVLKWTIIANVGFGIAAAPLSLAPTMFVNLILKYIEDPIPPRPVAWLYVFGLGFAQLLHNIVVNQAFYHGRRLSVGIRALIICSVYRKALYRKVSVNAADSEENSDTNNENDQDEKDGAEDEHEFDPSSTGAVLNLMSVDAFKVADFCAYLHDVFASPLTVLASIYFLYRILSWSAFAGLIVLLFSLPLNYFVAEKISMIQDKLMAVSDRRIAKTNELLSAIRIVKYFAWEQHFIDSISDTRKKELHLLYMRYVYWSLGALLFLLMPMLILLSSFYCFVKIQGGVLTSSRAFTALSIYQIMRWPLDDMQNIVTNIANLRVSTRRIGAYLSEEETPRLSNLSVPTHPDDPELGFRNASFTWDNSEDESFQLRDLNFDFIVGDVNVVVGPTGAGKTSLLLALLGEMNLKSGRVFLPHTDRPESPVDPSTGLANTVAYCSQQAWLVNDTIKNNILFAAPYDRHRYRLVLEACELQRDFDVLTDGDQTLIGDKGIALSGGQKQRVSLARALYSNSKHLILDDCLSAVDSHTAGSLYENALTGNLAQNRTIILVSHNVALTISKAANVIVLQNGRVLSQGSPTDVSKSGYLGDDELVIRSAAQSTISRANSRADLVGMQQVNPEETLEMEVQAEENKMSEEERAVGKVDPKTFGLYLRALGGTLWFFIALTLVVSSPVVEYLEAWWLKVWSSNSATDSSLDLLIHSKIHNLLVTSGVDDDTAKSLTFYVSIYAAIGACTGIVGAARDVVCYFGSVSASRKLFDRLLRTVVHARVRFFDKTPTGRIINRFSKDMEGIDQELMANWVFFVMSAIDALTVTVVISYVTPFFMPMALFLFYIFAQIGSTYLNCSRELWRFQSVSRSPIFQQFGETIIGAVTIRAYGCTRRFYTENMNLVDYNHRPYFYLWLANRWLAFWSEFTTMAALIFSASLLVWNSSAISAGMAGVALSYAMSFGDAVLWVVRLYSEVDIQMNSVERVSEYFEIEQEAAQVIPESRPPVDWPSEGAIEFHNLSLRYDEELPLVIKNVSFKVAGGLKVGVVGRTGAGKSTIISALFRMLEADTGSILLDGVDISTIGLRDLRQALAIIPQDPTLFKGTLRSNLDMFGEYEDNEIFAALACVRLVPQGTTRDTAELNDTEAGENSNRFLNLDSAVADGGANLSQGQRQLVCLARSILKHPRVLLLDEATASIDYDTDAMIQRTIRSSFHDVTILTIAHRLRTIADYDLVLVLEKGNLAQFGTPAELLSDHSGIFYSMCEKSGELDALVDLAYSHTNH